MAPGGVAGRWTLSRWLMPDIRFWEFASIENSRCGRAMTHSSGIRAALDKSVKDRWIMNSNRLAFFAASLQCTDEVKVVSREPEGV